MSYVGPLMKDLLDNISKEVKKKENKDKIINNIIDPLAHEVFKRYSVYIFCFVLLQIIMLVLLVYIACNVKK